MSDILDRWSEIKVLVETLELDVHKNATGNASAGVRVRKGLRALKKDVGDLVKLSIEEDKSKKQK